MELINILITLGIIYLAFLIIDKFGLYLIAISLMILLIFITPHIFNLIRTLFTWLMSLVTKPVYWITGIEIILPWWLGLAIFMIPIIFMFQFTGIGKKDNGIMI